MTCSRRQREKSYDTLSLSNLLGEKNRSLTSTVAEGGEKERVPQDIRGARSEVRASKDYFEVFLIVSSFVALEGCPQRE